MSDAPPTWPDMAYWRERALQLERELADARHMIDALTAHLATRIGSLGELADSDPVALTDAPPDAPR